MKTRALPTRAALLAEAQRLTREIMRLHVQLAKFDKARARVVQLHSRRCQ